MQPSIREAITGDAQRIAQLAGQLGYTTPLDHVERYVALSREEHELFVAVVPRAGVVGWIGVAQHFSILSSHTAQVEGLVIEDEYRSQGLGALLLEAAEMWARRRGCTGMQVRTNVTRERAHVFYVRCGYELLKSQHIFAKTL